MKSTVQEVCRPQNPWPVRVAPPGMSGFHVQEALVLFRSWYRRIEE